MPFIAQVLSRLNGVPQPVNVFRKIKAFYPVWNSTWPLPSHCLRGLWTNCWGTAAETTNFLLDGCCEGNHDSVPCHEGIYRESGCFDWKMRIWICSSRPRHSALEGDGGPIAFVTRWPNATQQDGINFYESNEIKSWWRCVHLSKTWISGSIRASFERQLPPMIQRKRRDITSSGKYVQSTLCWVSSYRGISISSGNGAHSLIHRFTVWRLRLQGNVSSQSM